MRPDHLPPSPFVDVYPDPFLVFRLWSYVPTFQPSLRDCSRWHGEPGKERKPGAKAQFFAGPSTARLKSCPDTKHYRGEDRKTRSARPETSVWSEKAPAP